MLNIMLLSEDKEKLKLLKEYVENYYCIKEKISQIYCCDCLDLAKTHLNLKWNIILVDLTFLQKYNNEIVNHLKQQETCICIFSERKEYINRIYQKMMFDYIWGSLVQEKITLLFDKIMIEYFRSSAEIPLYFVTTIGIVKVQKNDILYLEYINSDKENNIYRSTKLITISHQFIVKDKLSSVHNMLNDEMFVSPHKSFIVNFNHIRGFYQNSVVMSNGEQIPLSQKKARQFKADFQNYLIVSHIHERKNKEYANMSMNDKIRTFS